MVPMLEDFCNVSADLRERIALKCVDGLQRIQGSSDRTNCSFDVDSGPSVCKFEIIFIKLYFQI